LKKTITKNSLGQESNKEQRLLHIKTLNQNQGDVMGTESDKVRVSKRRLKDENAIRKQVKIAKAHGLTNKDKVVKEPHRLAKHHVMDCGNPGCYICGNPRKTHKDKLTMQEKRFIQDVDHQSNKHSNGKTEED
jgi:hypothetical protein